MYDYYDERMANLDRQRAEQREAERSLASYNQGGIVGMALLPFAAAVGALCGTLRLIAEKRRDEEQYRAEAKCLEGLILNATARAQDGQIVPMERILGVHERG